MKKAIGIISFIYLLVITACSQEQDSRLLSPKELSEDFEYLVETLDEMNPDLYAFISKDDFNNKVERIRDDIKNPMSLLDFYLKVTYLVHSVKQGHTQASYMLDFWQDCKSGMIPLNFRVIDNQLFVKENYSNLSDLVPGSEILSINGIPSADLIDTVGTYTLKETETLSSLVLEGRFPYYLWMVFQFNDGYKVKYITPFMKQINTSTLKGLSVFAYGDRRYPNKEKREYNFEIDEHGIGIMRIGSFGIELDPFKNFIDSVFRVIQNENINNLIIDIRDNDGGDIVPGYLILDYLATQNMKFADKYYTKTCELTKKLHKDPNLGELSPMQKKYWPYDNDIFGDSLLNRPDGTLFEVKLREFTPDPVKYKYKGKLYVLTNGLVFSSALPFVYLIKDYGLATIVGEETGIVSPAFGEPLRYRLPNSQIEIMNSTSYLIRPNGIVNNRGVIPEYIVEPNILDLVK